MDAVKFIVWEDSFGCPAGWQFRDDIEERTSVVHSVGFVVSEDEEKITLSPHIAGKNLDNQQFAGVVTIPKRQIISSSLLEDSLPRNGFIVGGRRGIQGDLISNG